MKNTRREFENKKHDITLQIDDISERTFYKRNCIIGVNFPRYGCYTPAELRKIGEWFIRQSEKIKQNFDSMGRTQK